MTYPRWQFAWIDGEHKQRIITSPDEEQPDVWKESPAELPPPAPPKPKLNDCCLALKAKFDAAWQTLTGEHEKLKAAHTDLLSVNAGFDAQWEAKVNELAGVQAELDQLKLAHLALQRKHDALLSAASAETADTEAVRSDPPPVDPPGGPEAKARRPKK